MDEEEAKLIRGILEGAGFELNREAFKKLVLAIESGIDWFLKTKDAESVTFRQKHDAMRDLFFLAQDGLYDPKKRATAIKALRLKIESLPDPVMSDMDRSGSLIISNLFRSWRVVSGGHEFWDPAGWDYNGGFRVWARSAEDEKLLRATQALTSRGAVVVHGRSRGGGKRSQPRIEPYVMGIARGGPDHKSKGGRPNLVLAFVFICGLANAWERATGRFPQAGRSDHTGFGDLVHQVFGWVGNPTSADNSLRYFWKEMKKEYG